MSEQGECGARAQLYAARHVMDDEVRSLRWELAQADNVIAAFAHDYELLERTNDMLMRQIREERARVVVLQRLAREAELVSEKVRVFCGE